MANVVKVALPGVNALTDTNPAHFSVYIDGTTDHILVKEKERATVEVSDFTTEEISHGLDYPPFNAQMVEVAAGEFQWVYNTPGASFNPFHSYVTDESLFLRNSDSVARDFTYLLFHDQL